MRHVHELQQSSATEASSLQLPPSCSGLLHHKQHFSTASDPLKPHNIGLVRYLCCLRIFGLLRKVGTPSLLRMRRNPHDIRRVVVQLQQPNPSLNGVSMQSQQRQKHVIATNTILNSFISWNALQLWCNAIQLRPALVPACVYRPTIASLCNVHTTTSVRMAPKRL